MRNFHAKPNTKYAPVINLDKLWSLVSEQTRQKYAKESEKAPVINVLKSVSVAVVGNAVTWPL